MNRSFVSLMGLSINFRIALRLLMAGVFLCAAAAAAPTAVAADADLVIENIALGYGGAFRPGRLCPLTVECRNNSDTPVDAQLRFTVLDQDDDIVEYRADIPLTPKSTAKRTLIVRMKDSYNTFSDSKLLLGSISGGNFTVVDNFKLNSGRKFGAIDASTVCVGVIGNNVGAMVRAGDSGRFGQEKPVPPLRIFAISADSLGGDWRSLDMVDVIFWENPDLASVSPDAQRAIAQWVKRGGHLVMALGPDAMSLNAAVEEFRSIVPVDIIATSAPSGKLDSLYQSLGVKAAGESEANICHMRAKSAEFVVSNGQRDLLCRAGRVGGMVTVLAGRLEDLEMTANDARTWMMLRALLGFYQPDNIVVGSTFGGGLSSSHIFNSILDQKILGGALVAVVLVLSLLYVLLAGPGSWFYLKARKLTKYSWWVFGAIAAGGSVAFVFLAMVSIGGRSVSQALVVDMDPGYSYAAVRGYCSAYIPSHTSVKVSLENDPAASLSPMIIESDNFHFGSDDSGFTDTQKYAIDCDVPQSFEPFFRRTAKSFACNWAGSVSGSVVAAVKINPPDDMALNVDRKSISSWPLSVSITNNFDVDLTSARLVYRMPGDMGLAVADLGTVKASEHLQLLPDGDRSVRYRSVTGIINGQQAMDWRGQGANLRNAILSASIAANRPEPTNAYMNMLDMRSVDYSSLLYGDCALLIASVDGDIDPVSLRLDGDKVPGSGQVVLRMLVPLDRGVTGKPRIKIHALQGRTAGHGHF